MTIDQALRTFCDEAINFRALSGATITRYRQGVRLYAKCAGTTYLHEITDKNVRSFFLLGRSSGAWKVRTYLTYRRSLIAFFDWCIKQKLLRKNYARALEKPRLPKSLPKSLTAQQARQVLSVVRKLYKYHYAGHRAHAVLSLFIFAGLRRSELLALDCADVNLEERTILVRHGKGDKDRLVPSAMARSFSCHFLRTQGARRLP